MANIRRLLFWAEAKVREIKRQWPKIIRYTPPINIFAFHFWPMTKIKDTAAAIILFRHFIQAPNQNKRAKNNGAYKIKNKCRK